MEKYIGIIGNCEDNDIVYECDDIKSEYFSSVVLDKIFSEKNVNVKKVSIERGIELFRDFMLWGEDEIGEYVEFGIMVEKYRENNCENVLFMYDKVNLECGIILVY